VESLKEEIGEALSKTDIYVDMEAGREPRRCGGGKSCWCLEKRGAHACSLNESDFLTPPEGVGGKKFSWK